VFGEDFDRFLDIGADRLVRLSGMLGSRGMKGRVLAVAGRRHVLVRCRGTSPRVMLAAHYDRVEGSPGALDNSAACLVLARLGASLSLPGAPEGVLLLFTDGEEAPALEGALAQGAFAVGRGLRAALGGSVPPILVLDVVGRGSRLLLSTAPRDLHARTGGMDTGLREGLDGIEGAVRRAAVDCAMPSPFGLPLPWSDDLGFTLAGIPALALSLLPEGEARRYRDALEDGSAANQPGTQRGAQPSAANLGDAWPETWTHLHGPGDGPELIQQGALEGMLRFCLEFCRQFDQRRG
jgi:hypothetical protein